MPDDLARIIVSTLVEYDFRHVSKEQMHQLIDFGRAWGMTDFEKHKVYLRNDLPRSDEYVTALHEIGHIYLKNTGADRYNEDEADRLAYEWMKRFYVG